MEQLHAHEVLHMMEGNSYSESSLRKAIVDKFGEDFDVEHISKDRFQTTVLANVIKTFFGWVFTYAGEIQIVGPEGVCKEYRKQLRKALK